MAGASAGLGPLVDGAVLRRVRDRLAGDALVDEHALVGQRLGRRADREHVGADGGVDRRGDVRVRGDREVDRGRGVQRDVEIGVEVEQGDDLLVGQRGAGLGSQLLGRERAKGVVLAHGGSSSVGVRPAVPVPEEPETRR